MKLKAKKEPQMIKIAKVPRAKRKFMTRVEGLGTFSKIFFFFLNPTSCFSLKYKTNLYCNSAKITFFTT